MFLGEGSVASAALAAKQIKTGNPEASLRLLSAQVHSVVSNLALFLGQSRHRRGFAGPTRNAQMDVFSSGSVPAGPSSRTEEA